MIFIFEDHPDSDISVLYRSAYNEDILRQFVYAKGNGNLEYEVRHYLLNTSENVIVFMDMIPGNRACNRIYNKLKLIARKNNYRVIILPIICAEFYMIKSIRNMNLFIDVQEVINCLDKQPHFLSNLMKDADIAKYCKNFEKYCKFILKYNVKNNCLKPFNQEQGKNGEYYRSACRCSVATEECDQLQLVDKAINLLYAYKYVPSGSRVVNVENLTENEMWNVHRKLVDEYNIFVKKYREVDVSAVHAMYNEINYIK